MAGMRRMSELLDLLEVRKNLVNLRKRIFIEPDNVIWAVQQLLCYCFTLLVTLSETFKTVCCFHTCRTDQGGDEGVEAQGADGERSRSPSHIIRPRPAAGGDALEREREQERMANLNAIAHNNNYPNPNPQRRERILIHDNEIAETETGAGGVCSARSTRLDNRDCRIPQMHWTVHIKGGPRRVNHAAVTVGHTIYSFGGYCTGENYSIIRPIDVYVLNPVTYRWKLLPLETDASTPFQRYGHTAVAYGRYVYLWGGRNDENACKILYRFDTKTLKWEKPMVNGNVPGARDGHSAVIIRNKMFIFGGYEEQIGLFSQDVHALNLETLTWSFIPTAGSPPTFRDFHTATVYLDRYMFIFGGRGDEHGPFHTRKEMYCNTLVCFDVERQEWFRPKTTGACPEGRRSHSAFMHSGFMYIFGGYNGVTNTHFNDLFRYDPEIGEWQQVTPYGRGPAPRRRQGCVVLDSRVFFFGGTSPIQNDMILPANPDDPEEMNLTDHDDMFVLDMDPSLKTLSILKISEHSMDTSWLPHILKQEIAWMMMPNKITNLSSG